MWLTFPFSLNQVSSIQNFEVMYQTKIRTFENERKFAEALYKCSLYHVMVFDL